MIWFSFLARWVFRLFSLSLLLILFACNTPPPLEPSLTSQPTEAATELPGELTLQQEMVFGPGSFIYTDTRAGLAELTSYQAELILAFEGTRAGQPWKWSQTYRLLASNEPVARSWTIEKSGDLPDLESVFQGKLDGLAYERRGELECTATELLEGNALTGRFELASLLIGVIGAEEAGTDRVNDLAANRYTFDQRALGEQDLSEATGEMWIASEGGYIVRYLLTTKAGTDYFGEGIEGTMTLSYELTEPNQPVTILLPEDCPPGMVNAPLLPDAANVERVPGALTYDTSTSLAEVAAFYQEQIPGLGWETDGDPSIAEAAAFLNYKRKNETLTISLSAEGDKTRVIITLGRSQE